MTVILTLGSVIFQDFEIPESIGIGGEQALVVHKLPGGSRTIDSMGADDRDISWSGRFRGGIAESRAAILDGYRVAGNPLQLSWSSYLRTVVIKSFEANYQAPFEIPYSITCTVVTSSTFDAILSGLTLLLGSDLANALTLNGAINVNSINSAMSTVSTAVAAAGNLKNANLSSVAGITSAIGAAQGATLGVTTQAETTLTAAGQLTPGASPTALASTLTTQATTFGQLNSLYQLSSTLSRMTTNVANRNN